MTARLAIIVILVAAVVSSTRVSTADERLTYERDIRPILKVHCLDCHGATAEVEGQLDLRLKRLMVVGGDSGPAIVPGDPAASNLVARIRAGEMPPGDKKISPTELAIIERWIATGAATSRAEPTKLDPGLSITPEEREFWSFQPLRRPEVPHVAASGRARTEIDAFVLARLHEVGLEFSPDADDRTLLMRAYFDLIGLPPSPAEVAAYLADPAADKYEQLIEDLLASPRYGERWARHWLDVAGYADSEGYTPRDDDRPWAYKYRDYVIRSLNEDKPFNVFCEEQLAGDELVPPPHQGLSDEQIEKLTATGFLRMAVDGTASANHDDARNHTIADTIKIVSTSLLGLSVGCAQCHDHRYDPIPQQDYFQLRAIFEPALNWKTWRTPPQRLVSLYTDQQRQTAAKIEVEAQEIAAERASLEKKFIEEELERELTKYEESLRDDLRKAYHTPDEQRTAVQKLLLKQNPAVNISGGTLYQYNQASADRLKEFDQRMADVRAKKPVQEFIRVLNEVPGEIPQTHLFYRGEHQQPRQAVSPAALTISAPPGQRHEIPVDSDALPTTGRRLAFARWLFSGAHPLVGRVLVNRVWLHHFGRGIVGTPGDFGVLGLRPTHPKLLDWLAVEFAESGWSLKHLHRQLMLSTVYRQSSLSNPSQAAVDAANQRYWRKPVVRLDAEAIYDRILATNGALDYQLYGPPVPIEADDAGQIIVNAGSQRRCIYVKVKRTQPVALLKSFDAPVMEVNCDCRRPSTVSTQSLMLMNSDFILKHARKLADRVRSEASAAPAPRIAFDSADLQDPHEAWQFGYGEFDPESQQTTGFTPLPYWTGSAWQGGKELPDVSLGWVTLGANGGHPGDRQHSPIRRWVAPRGGTVQVRGSLHHPSEHGDGVVCRLVSSRDGKIAEWISRHNQVDTHVEAVAVQAGDALDFLTECRESVTSDSFAWSVTVELTGGVGATQTWASAKDFHGPRTQLDPWPQQVVYAWQLAYGRSPTDEELSAALAFLTEQFEILRGNRDAAAPIAPSLQAMTNLCQVLLSSNEFLYVD